MIEFRVKHFLFDIQMNINQQVQMNILLTFQVEFKLHNRSSYMYIYLACNNPWDIESSTDIHSSDYMLDTWCGQLSNAISNTITLVWSQVWAMQKKWSTRLLIGATLLRRHMSVMASWLTGNLTTGSAGHYQRKHQTLHYWLLVRGIHRDLWFPTIKGQ